MKVITLIACLMLTGCAIRIDKCEPEYLLTNAKGEIMYVCRVNYNG